MCSAPIAGRNEICPHREIMPVDEYFGSQRKQGQRSDNPDFHQTLYNDNAIRIQKEISITSGNTRGGYDKKRSWENVTDEKLQKTKRVKKSESKP